MKPLLQIACAAIVSTQILIAQSSITVPKTVNAGDAFSIQTSGSGPATLYIVGMKQVLRRQVQLGEAVSFPAGTLTNAGQYVVALGGNSAEGETFQVVPASQPSRMSFIARPSRLPVSLHNGITGAAYVFDAYQNLILTPMDISFELTSPSGETEKRSVKSSFGAAWTTMDSSKKQGNDKFVARAGDVASERIVGQAPGEPCSLKISARPTGKGLEVETEPVEDCSGNAVPDGTVVTFTETYGGDQSTVDVPLKRGVAKVEMPARPGATITVASGVTMGNQIHWSR